MHLEAGNKSTQLVDIVYTLFMTEDLWLLFYGVYGLAAVLMLAILIKGLVKGDPMKKIGRALVRPLGMIIGSLIFWFSYIYIAKDIGSRF